VRRRGRAGRPVSPRCSHRERRARCAWQCLPARVATGPGRPPVRQTQGRVPDARSSWFGSSSSATLARSSSPRVRSRATDRSSVRLRHLRDGPHPAAGRMPTLRGPATVVLAGRATTVPFTTDASGCKRTPTDNLTAAMTCAVCRLTRWRLCPIWLCKQGVAHRRRELPPQYPLAAIGKVGGAYGLDDFVSGNVELSGSRRHVLIEFRSRKGLVVVCGMPTMDSCRVNRRHGSVVSLVALDSPFTLCWFLCRATCSK
jgi:hypothetical protein